MIKCPLVSARMKPHKELEVKENHVRIQQFVDQIPAQTLKKLFLLLECPVRLWPIIRSHGLVQAQLTAAQTPFGKRLLKSCLR